MRGVGEGGAEEHGGRSGRRRGRRSSTEVEGDGGAVGLVAVEEDVVVAGDGVGGFELLDLFGEVLRGEHGREADEGDVRGDEEDGAGEGDGGGCGEMAAFGAEEPCDGGADGEGQCGEGGGKAEGGEAMEPVRSKKCGHGEGVVAYAAVGEEVSDVGDEGEMAGGPEAVGEGDAAMARPMMVKVAWAKVIQRREDLSSDRRCSRRG